MRHLRDVDVDGTEMAEAWIPIQPSPQELFYYSPTLGLSVRHLPRGAVAAAVQLEVQHASLAGVLEGNGTTVAPAPAANATNVTTTTTTTTDGPTTSGAAGAAWLAPTTTAVPTLVPEQLRKSCVPHCRWNCTEPVCEQHCKPECGVPSCQTQCPKRHAGAFVGCKVRCGEPNCAMYCPPDPCKGRKTLDCVTPKCTTHCEKPKCSVDCGHSSFGCQTVCPTPACEWKCSKPTCPKPQCSMQCEAPPKCDTTMSVPPPGADELVMGKKQAHMKKPEWKTSLWGACSSQCGAGTQTRKVICSAGDEAFCAETKPASAKACEDVVHCQYQVGLWSTCSNKCGKGVKTRSVECNGKQCLGDKPETEEECVGHAATCEECAVTLYGGKKFSGWSMMFEPGNYTAPELEYRGVKCDDISSLEVVGDFCKLQAFEFGDFNAEHPGWKAEFVAGKYDATELAPQGAKNDDISSFKLVRLPNPDATELQGARREARMRTAVEKAADAVSKLTPHGATPRLRSTQ